jgi:predicted transcriptional regulator
MTSENPTTLSRREREIMDVIYAASQATAAQVLAGLADPPSYSAVRALLRILEEKGHLRHKAVKGKYLYSPIRARGHAGRGALGRVLRTFFDNSPAKVMAALLDTSDLGLTDAELDELTQLIEKTRRRGKKS